MIRAIALISGGLDSILAARLIQRQQVRVLPLKFNIPFSSSSDYAYNAARNLGEELAGADLGEEFLEIIKNPKYGFGSNMNPCIDCKILMLRKAKELLGKWDAKFVITGEVLGQRPMSQNRQTLQVIEKKSGLEGLLLRPLSAKLLPESIPEKNGWVKRDCLMGFSGRTRKPQIELANSMGIKDYPNPAGGCLLTDPGFAKRLKESLGREGLSLKNIELLKIGRHFRIAENTKLVVGRDEQENKKLEGLAAEDDFIFMPQEAAGPTALGRGEFNEELIRLSCALISRYCDSNGKGQTAIRVIRMPQGQEEILQSPALEEQRILDLRI